MSVRPEVVLIFPVTAEGQVILVRQYKHGAGQILIEFPGGIFNSVDEPGEVAAARELAEETGYSAASLELLGTIWDDPAKQTNRIHLYLARDVVKTQEQDLDDIEAIEMLKVPLAEIQPMVMRGEISVSSSVNLAWLSLNTLKSDSQG